MRTADVNDRIEIAKKLILGLADDAQKILTMTQMAIPVGEVVARRVLDRIFEIRDIFSTPPKEEEDSANGTHA